MSGSDLKWSGHDLMKVAPRNVLGGTEENHEYIKLGWPTSRPRPGLSIVQIPAGPRQHSNYWFWIPSVSKTKIFVLS
jgi:hypothetical protein